jgi:hypothetical protein
MPDIELDQLQIASPCKADWDAMAGDAQVRFCGQCKLNVYNLSGMTRAQAQTLVESREGRLCVRFFRRDDGTILTQDCPVGWAAVQRRLWLVKTALVSAAAVFLAAWSPKKQTAACHARNANQMGRVAAPTAQPPAHEVKGGIRAMPITGLRVPSQPLMGKRAASPKPKRAEPFVGDVVVPDKKK